MPKAAIFFSIILLSFVFSIAYGFTGGDLVDNNFVQKNYDIFDSDIVNVPPDFFTQNNYKRYVIFGAGSNDFDFLKKNSLYGIESDRGFFHVAVLEENSVSNLISRGYTVIEDFALDFHSEGDVPDASRIGEITGSSSAETKYNVTGKGITIAIVDTGVDFQIQN